MWSPDDDFILAFCSKSREVHLRCVNSAVVEDHQEDWAGKVVDELGGIESVCWAPDSRQVITYATNNLRICIWSLLSQELTSYISNYKMLPPKGIAYTNNMKFVALAEK